MKDVVHRQTLGIFFAAVSVLAGMLVLSHPSRVDAADICWPQRSMSERRCVPKAGLLCAETCPFNCDSQGNNCGHRCYYSGGRQGSRACGAYGPSEGEAKENCELLCVHKAPYNSASCADGACTVYISGGTDADCVPQSDRIVPCLPESLGCVTTVRPVDCDKQINQECHEYTRDYPMGCWGPGDTPTPEAACGDGTCDPGAGESCSNCQIDCGPCPPTCPNGVCDIDEDCNTCPQDCTCPPTTTPAPGKIQARAMLVSDTDTSCATGMPAGTGITGAAFSFSAPAPSTPTPAPPTQSGNSYVVFNNAAAGVYTINASVPPQYTLNRYCSGSSEVTKSQQLASAGTVTWDLVYTPGTAWSQAEGADVYAAVNLKSPVPVPHPPPPPPATNVFILDGTTGGYPGLATYGVSGSFDDSGLTNGQDWASSKKWMVQDTAPGTDFYQLMYSQFGGAPATVDYVNPAPVSQPASRATPYYVTGNMTTSGSWSILSGQTVIFFVYGNLEITNNITIAPGGFAAFIVISNITVDPTVTAVDGVYITSPRGVFDTGTGSVQFVGTGMFIAGDFTLGRNLGAGNTTPSELFTYNPELLMLMPQQMKRLPVYWQEVAP